MSEPANEQQPAQEKPGADPDIYERSVAANTDVPGGQDDRPVVESNSSNYGGSSVVGEQGDA